MVGMLAMCVALTTQDPPKPDETPVEVYLKDGLRFRTKDGNFEARIGGRFIDSRSRGTNPQSKGLLIVVRGKQPERVAQAPDIDELMHLARLTN